MRRINVHEQGDPLFIFIVLDKTSGNPACTGLSSLQERMAFACIQAEIGLASHLSMHQQAHINLLMTVCGQLQGMYDCIPLQSGKTHLDLATNSDTQYGMPNEPSWAYPCTITRRICVTSAAFAASMELLSDVHPQGKHLGHVH